MKFIFLLKAILMLIFPFYRVEMNEYTLPKSFIILKFKNGIPVEKIEINSSALVYSKITKFMLDEKRGWKYDFNTYAPVFFLESDKLKINCNGKKVVINYENSISNEWTQVSKELDQKCESYF